MGQTGCSCTCERGEELVAGGRDFAAPRPVGATRADQGYETAGGEHCCRALRKAPAEKVASDSGSREPSRPLFPGAAKTLDVEVAVPAAVSATPSDASEAPAEPRAPPEVVVVPPAEEARTPTAAWRSPGRGWPDEPAKPGVDQAGDSGGLLAEPATAGLTKGMGVEVPFSEVNSLERSTGSSGLRVQPKTLFHANSMGSMDSSVAGSAAGRKEVSFFGGPKRLGSGLGSSGNIRISSVSTQAASALDTETPPHPHEKRFSYASGISAVSLMSQSTAEEAVGGDTDSDNDRAETYRAPQPFLRPRRGALCVGKLEKRMLTPPVVPKNGTVKKKLRSALEAATMFQSLNQRELEDIVLAMTIEQVMKGTRIVKQGDAGDALYAVIAGAVDCYREKPPREPAGPMERTLVTSREAGTLFGEVSIMSNVPRSLSVYAQQESILGRLDRLTYHNLVVHRQYHKRGILEECLRSVKLLELLGDEQIAKLADALAVRIYQPGEVIIRQGEVGKDFFIVKSGTCVATVTTFDDVQEVRRYHSGDLFGELALLKNAKRAATITAADEVEVMSISRRSFERMLGPLSLLQESQYLRDPRKLVADFYRPGDKRGPLGSLQRMGVARAPDAPVTLWFAVFRPTSRDAIAKMLGGIAVGKGLNVKGKSSKKNRLSGFVPFVQITNNEHKGMLEPMPAKSRVRIYYKSRVARQQALNALLSLRNSRRASGCSTASMPSGLTTQTAAEFVDDETCDELRLELEDSYAPSVFGLDAPGMLIFEAYITQADLSPIVGWETGRSSEPAFMDMNLQAVCSADSEPRVVLLQHDEGDPMNAQGLLVSYAEECVKPVVSDFDAFLIASRGVNYEPLSEEQTQYMTRVLNKAEEIVRNPGSSSWTTRWLEHLKSEAEAGIHPHTPKYGFGDPTSYRLIDDIISQTSACGAVRHGAECFNFYFPQELDDEYLVVWEGFPDKPWEYVTEPGLREFLLKRVSEGFTFPLNPVWAIRDPGWYEVWQALQTSDEGRRNFSAWFPNPDILRTIDKVHEACPKGFTKVGATKRPSLEHREQAALELSVVRRRKSVKDFVMPVTSVYSKLRNTARRASRHVPSRRRSTESKDLPMDGTVTGVSSMPLICPNGSSSSPAGNPASRWRSSLTFR